MINEQQQCRLTMNKTFTKEETMKATNSKRTLTALLAAAMIAVVLPAAVQAAGTIAGTGITNSVSVDYSIGGVPASAAVVSTATFTVGVRLNMTVTRQNANFVDAAPSAANMYMTFVVTNVTNTSLDFGLVSAVSATNPYDGAANTFVTVPTVTAYVDANGNNAYDPGTDTAVFSAITSDASATVFVVGTIPAGEANGALQAFSLTAVARAFGSGAGATTNLTEGAGTYNGVDMVFGDAANGTVTGDANRDARASDRSAFRISAITVAKTATVYWDPLNLTSSPRPIPGAIITYLVTITNPGSSSATSVSIADALGALPVTFRTQFDDGTGLGCTGVQGIAVDPGTGTFGCRTNTNGDGDFADFTAGTANVTNLTVNAGGTVRIKYQVTVN